MAFMSGGSDKVHGKRSRISGRARTRDMLAYAMGKGLTSTRKKYALGPNIQLIFKALDEHLVPRMSIGYWKHVVEFLYGKQRPFSKTIYDYEDLNKLVEAHEGSTLRVGRERREKCAQINQRGPNWQGINMGIESTPMPPAPFSYWLASVKKFFRNAGVQFTAKDSEDFLRVMTNEKWARAQTYLPRLILVAKKVGDRAVVETSPSRERAALKEILGLLEHHEKTQRQAAARTVGPAMLKKAPIPVQSIIETLAKKGICTNARSVNFLEFMHSTNSLHFMKK